ncbi:MMPL family transporter [Pseudonocardia acaciae]|uniref:MMPL family transporter n=1 Tax=Pseudonocardia acaciae TaxID=551276 RepID=UPI000A03330F|nr:MMPL family transporter [Pseudonocardia acaciae]
MLGRLVVRRARWVVGIGVLVMVVAGVAGGSVVDLLSLNRFEAPGSESMRAREALADGFGTASPNVALLVTATEGGGVDDPEVAVAGRALTERLAAYPGVGGAWSYWSRGGPATLRSVDGRRAMVLAWVPGDADRVRRDVLPGLVPRFAQNGPVVRVEVGGGDEVFRNVMVQARRDFVRAELVVLPLALLLLWLVYRRFVAAALTLGVGVFAVLGSLALLRAVVELVEISTFAANISLVMGIGLGVDYGLFMIFRFREELRGGAEVPVAVVRTVRTAGRTVLFSGLTVAASLAVLFVFPFPFLSSFGYAGIAVVLAAVCAATVVLPAALALLGHRVARRRHGLAQEAQGVWGRIAGAVVRRPVALGGAALVVVLALGAPFLGVRFGLPDDRVLPGSASVRQLYDQVRAGFVAEEADAVMVVAAGRAADPAATGDYAAALSRLDGVVRVDSAAGSYAAGAPTAGPTGVNYANATGTWLSVVVDSRRLEADPTGVVGQVRAVPAPYPVLVGGYPAELTDYRDGVAQRLPLVALLIVLVTFAVLFGMTGSLVAPVKAAVLNLLSLSVMFGTLVFVFQWGNLAGVLGFTPTGSIEPSIPILMFCIAYGLSMDYEVLLLSRIKEEYDRTGDPVGSVPAGIARSAPLVTAAAAILAISFLAYATGEVVFLQQLGVGTAVTVIVDATLIRGFLAPAAMRLAGRANWWTPGSPRWPRRSAGGDRAALQRVDHGVE